MIAKLIFLFKKNNIICYINVKHYSLVLITKDFI